MSKKFDFNTVGGKKYTFSIPEPADMNSFFVFSLPKAGSTLLMNIMTDVCQALSIPAVDFPTRAFTLGIQPTELRKDINSLWQDRGYAYVGFRSFLPPMEFDFSKTKNILLIRDPRDMLVSLYFSIRYSHVVPKLDDAEHPIARQRAALENAGIDQTVLNMAQSYRKYFQDYIAYLPLATSRIYRYEDIIFKKREWIEDMLNFLSLKLQKDKIKAIAEKYDIRPDREDPHKHVRQVTPGNYKTHLSQPTIDKLDEIFRPVMRYFHYDSVVSLKMDPPTQGIDIPCRHDLLTAMEEHTSRLENDLAELRQSWSWRITAPLRWLASFLKEIR